MKIQRQKQIDTTTDTHTIMITLTVSDVKGVFLRIREILNKSLGLDYNPTFTKNDLIFSIRKHFSFLGEYGRKLDEWAFDVALRNDFLLKVSEVGYKINPTIMELRPGRTSKEVSTFLHR